MAIAKRIFLISDFKELSPASVRSERRRWIKGFTRLGHDVQTFSYRNVTKQFSFMQKTEYALRLGRKQTEQTLLDFLKSYHPDCVMILTMKDIRPECFDDMRGICPRAVFIGRDVDWFPQNNPERLAIAEKMDIITATNADSWLAVYKNLGVPRCAFIPCPCDPDIQRTYEPDPRLQTDILFTGSAVHSDCTEQADPDRERIVAQLTTMPNARVFGTHGFEKIDGIDVFRAIANAKIALSINAVNHIKRYHSDRLVNCLACGTFTLAKRVPETDLLFKDGVEAKYFDSAEEFFELADYYLKHDEERQKIAAQGMGKAQRDFNCTQMAKHVNDLMEKGDYDAEWKFML